MSAGEAATHIATFVDHAAARYTVARASQTSRRATDGTTVSPPWGASAPESALKRARASPLRDPGTLELFRRLRADRVADGGGARLGLSIERAVARAHHGEVTPLPRDDGLAVTVSLLAAP